MKKQEWIYQRVEEMEEKAGAIRFPERDMDGSYFVPDMDDDDPQWNAQEDAYYLSLSKRLRRALDIPEDYDEMMKGPDPDPRDDPESPDFIPPKPREIPQRNPSTFLFGNDPGHLSDQEKRDLAPVLKKFPQDYRDGYDHPAREEEHPSPSCSMTYYLWISQWYDLMVGNPPFQITPKINFTFDFYDEIEHRHRKHFGGFDYGLCFDDWSWCWDALDSNFWDE
jgi:hypothetical protein